MNKNYILIIAICILLTGNANAQAPDWLWAKAMGDSSVGVIGNSIAIDAFGNVYTTGDFTGTIDFDPGAGVFNLTSSGLSDIFISKLDGFGNFVWAKRMGGMAWDQGYSIAIDPSGSGAIYTTGFFGSIADFDPGTGLFNLIAAASDDIFISKLDYSGNFIWAKAWGGTGSEAGWSIAVNPGGNGEVYTTGFFAGTVDFDPGAGTFNLMSTAGSDDIFISKLDSSGNFVWAKGMGSADQDGGLSIAPDPAGSGDVYTTGWFGGTVDFDPNAGTFNLTSAGLDDIFISKLDGAGNFVWTKAMGGTNYDSGRSLAIDSAGSGCIYTTGGFNGTVDFDPDAGIFNLASTGSYDIFISKLDYSGNFLWAKAIGGTSGDFGEAIALDASGNVYTTGQFSGTSDFDPGPGVFNLTPVGNVDIFVSRLESSGNFAWAKAMGGTLSDRGKSIALGSSGNAHMAGFFYSPSISFDATTLTNANASGFIPAIFIARLDTVASVPTGNQELNFSSNGILLFPNPVTHHLTIALSSNNKVEVTISDITGKIIFRTTARETPKIEVNIGPFAEGIYVVKIQAADFTETRKLIVSK